jgi:excisionase family DNA binding protein
MATTDRIPSLVSTREAAVLLHIHPRTVRRLADGGRLRACQYPGFRGLLFDLDEVTAFARSGFDHERQVAA